MLYHFPVFRAYIDDSNFQVEEPIIWTAEDINNRIATKSFQCSYGARAKNDIMAIIKRGLFSVKDKHLLVVGSQTPWMEAILLSEGASRVTTLDYTKIESRHPNVDTLTQVEMKEKFARGELKNKFDGVVSFSSLEHSGLGR